jgi:hypothetical protein
MSAWCSGNIPGESLSPLEVLFRISFGRNFSIIPIGSTYTFLFFARSSVRVSFVLAALAGFYIVYGYSSPSLSLNAGEVAFLARPRYSYLRGAKVDSQRKDTIRPIHNIRLRGRRSAEGRKQEIAYPSSLASI